MEPEDVKTGREAESGGVPNALVRVFEYGCGHDAICRPAVAIEQMFRRNELWNRIVEIDNDVRTKMDATLLAGNPEEELGLLRERLKQLRTRVTALRADRRSTETERNNVRQQVKTFVAEVRASLDHAVWCQSQRPEIDPGAHATHRPHVTLTHYQQVIPAEVKAAATALEAELLEQHRKRQELLKAWRTEC